MRLCRRRWTIFKKNSFDLKKNKRSVSVLSRFPKCEPSSIRTPTTNTYILGPGERCLFTSLTPKPHCRITFELAETDFKLIMYVSIPCRRQCAELANQLAVFSTEINRPPSVYIPRRPVTETNTEINSIIFVSYLGVRSKFRMTPLSLCNDTFINP